jgi:type I restriction enzyme M protein
MWRRVDIRNYRSIERVTVELAPFTMLVGPNGAGKSNFADALVFARDVATDAATAVERRGGISAVRRWRPTKPTDVMVDIVAAASRAALATDYVRHSFTIHSGKDGTWSFRRELVERIAGGSSQLSIVRDRSKLKLGTGGPSTLSGLDSSFPPLSDTASAMVFAHAFVRGLRTTPLRNVRRIHLSPEIMRLPQTVSDITRLDETGINIAVAFRSLPEPAKAQVLAAMRKIVPGLVDIRVEPFDRFLLLRFDQQQAGGELATFSATEMSEGALRALGILVAAQQMTKDELLIIEEPEVSIHVGAAQLLFDVLKDASRRGAVLLTSHSADLLDAARDEEILVCSYREGITRIGPLAKAQRQVVKDGLFSVAELMRTEPLRIEGEPPVAAEE